MAAVTAGGAVAATAGLFAAADEQENGGSGKHCQYRNYDYITHKPKPPFKNIVAHL